MSHSIGHQLTWIHSVILEQKLGVHPRTNRPTEQYNSSRGRHGQRLTLDDVKEDSGKADTHGVFYANVSFSHVLVIYSARFQQRMIGFLTTCLKREFTGGSVQQDH